MSEFRTAVVVPVFNRSKAVIEALDSVAAQSFPPARVIVVDDGSTDSTADRIQQWIATKREPFETRLIRQPNRGAAAARNRAVEEAADCDLLAFLDSDDLWPADYLKRMNTAFTSHTEAVAATCDRLHLDCKTNRTELHPQQRLVTATTATIFADGQPGQPNTVIRADDFRALGGYDPTLLTGEDYHLMLRLSLRGPWLYVPGTPVTVRKYISHRTRDEPPLSRKYSDQTLWRAQMMDRFIHQEGGAAAVPEKIWRRRLGSLWYRAGAKMAKLDRKDEAVKCFRRAVEVCRTHMRARLQIMAAR